MNNQDFKIKDDYFINLDQYFDIDEVQGLYSEIARGIVLSKDYIIPVELGRQDALYDKNHIEPILFIREKFSLTDEYKELLELGFSRRQIYEYVLFKFPVMSLGNKLLLRTYENYSSSFNQKHLSENNKDRPCYIHFPGLKTWIKNSKVFSEIGRIIIFINEKGSYTPTHCDYQNLKSLKDQFIWINLFSKKKFFVYNSNFEKKYLSGVINTFDNASWHGSEPADYSCFTIRIDGIFDKKFLKKTNLYEHYYNKD
jgi:hypothetical protein